MLYFRVIDLNYDNTVKRNLALLYDVLMLFLLR